MNLFSNYFLAGFAFFLFAWFAIGVKTVFRNPGQQIFGYNLLKFGAATNGLGIVWSIALERDLSLLKFYTVFLCFALSLILFRWAAYTIRHQKLSVAFSTDLPNFFIRQGPYRFIRHPFYLAYMTGYLGGIIAVPNFLTITGTLFMLGIYIWAARFEEKKFSASDLSSEYMKYKKEVGLIFPKSIGSKISKTRKPESESEFAP